MLKIDQNFIGLQKLVNGMELELGTTKINVSIIIYMVSGLPFHRGHVFSRYDGTEKKHEKKYCIIIIYYFVLPVALPDCHINIIKDASSNSIILFLWHQ